MDRDSSKTGTYTFGYLSDLLTWHEKYPAETWEKTRNDAVCAAQGNRNPFVDRPELVTAVFFNATAGTGVGGGGTPSLPPTSSSSTPSSSSSPLATNMPWINEIHYDNAGTDAGEFVEVALPVPARGGPSPADVTVALFNGKDAKPYWGPKPLTGGGTPFVAGSSGGGDGSGGVTLYSAAISGIQNGAPDGVALSVRVGGGGGGSSSTSSSEAAGDTTTRLIQFLSYEGIISLPGSSSSRLWGGEGGAAADGVKSTDMGVEETSSTIEGTSLSLVGSGHEYASFRWVAGEDTPSTDRTIFFF